MTRKKNPQSRLIGRVVELNEDARQVCAHWAKMGGDSRPSPLMRLYPEAEAEVLDVVPREDGEADAQLLALSGDHVGAVFEVGLRWLKVRPGQRSDEQRRRELSRLAAILAAPRLRDSSGITCEATIRAAVADAWAIIAEARRLVSPARHRSTASADYSGHDPLGGE